MKKKIKIISIIFGCLLVIYLGWSIYRLFFYEDISVVPKEEFVYQSTSPNKDYTIRFYRANGGPTVDFAMLGIMENKKTQEKQRMYWEYPCREIKSIKWDEKYVTINGTKIKIWKEIYDFRFGVYKDE